MSILNADIQLLPVWKPSEVRTRLRVALENARSLRAAVAFFTIQPNYLSDLLYRRISKGTGFLCVDYHLPTDIDELADLTQIGGDVHIFCQKATTKNRHDIVESRHLLHSKLLLFSNFDGTCELWVGSHNWTDRALSGLNIESSLVLKVPESSPLVSSAVDYLDSIRALCEPFDSSKVDFYKDLQREAEEPTPPVIQLEGPEPHKLSNSTLNFFGTETEERNTLSRIGMKVYLAVYDELGGETQFLYPGRIIQAGVMKRLNPRAGEIDFSDRRHAFRSGRNFPRLLPEQDISPEVLNNATYFATIEVDTLEHGSVALEPPERMKLWEAVPGNQSPLLARMSEADSRQVFRNSRPKIKVPNRDRERAAPYVPNREQRYTLAGASPVRKMIIRRSSFPEGEPEEPEM